MHKITFYHLRFYAYLSLLAVAVAGKYTSYFIPSTTFILVALAIITPNMSYLVSLIDTSIKNRNKQDQIALIMIDVIIVCIIAVLIGENNIITMLFILVVAFNTNIVSNLRYALIALLCLCSFMAISTTLFITQDIIQPPTPVIAVLIFCLGIYFSVCAQYMHQKEAEKDQMQQSMVQLEKEYQTTSQNLMKYISPQVWEAVGGYKKHEQLATQRKRLTIFFSDIKDFTLLSEELESEALTELLNHYITEMSNIAHFYGGTIDKFIGDSLMITFGDTNSLGAKKDAIAAASMAFAMRNHMKSIRTHWYSKGIVKQPKIRMGINTGYCTVGHFGSNNRMEYTVIGREVNLASRLENAASSGEILIAEETYALIKDMVLCQDKGEISVKGFTKPVHIYEALGLHKDLRTKTHYIEHETKGFSMYFDSTNINEEEKARIIDTLEKASNRLKST